MDIEIKITAKTDKEGFLDIRTEIDERAKVKDILLIYNFVQDQIKDMCKSSKIDVDLIDSIEYKDLTPQWITKNN